ncbi:MAG: hypothetical protein GY765_11480 [bacterium]|nr:hypothetical protein [bacterium]
MKTKLSNKALTVKKETIANLEMSESKGGVRLNNGAAEYSPWCMDTQWSACQETAN